METWNGRNIAGRVTDDRKIAVVMPALVAAEVARLLDCAWVTTLAAEAPRAFGGLAELKHSIDFLLIEREREGRGRDVRERAEANSLRERVRTLQGIDVKPEV